MRETYLPRPLDTSEVEMPPELDGLVERLAENVHEVWASRRLADGWTLGQVRDDDRKTHPCLVPFAELPESEKAYDRDVALETIKAILRLGFHVVAPR